LFFTQKRNATTNLSFEISLIRQKKYKQVTFEGKLHMKAFTGTILNIIYVVHATSRVTLQIK